MASDAAQRAAAARLPRAAPDPRRALPIALTRPKRTALAATNAAIQNSVPKLAATTRLGVKKNIYRN